MGRWTLWTLELCLTVLGVVWLAQSLGPGVGPEILLVWDLLALAYVVTGWLLLRHSLPADRSQELLGIVGPRWYTAVFALVASGSGVIGGLALTASRDAGDDPVVQAVAALTVLMSWLLLHTAFARLYARAFFADGGLRFPECQWPQLAEFVYFSFAIGTSFAVSDVSVVSGAMRRRVTAHSVLSFFFNAAVVAIAIDWLKS